MYARSITSMDGLAGGASAISCGAGALRTRSGSASAGITISGDTTAARSRAFSSSRTLPGQSYVTSSSHGLVRNFAPLPRVGPGQQEMARENRNILAPIP